MRKKLFYPEKQQCELCGKNGTRYIEDAERKLILCSHCFKTHYMRPISYFKKQMFNKLEEIKNEKETYSCNECIDKSVCEYAWDDYNVNCDCLSK